jgi:hypothetical protein
LKNRTLNRFAQLFIIDCAHLVEALDVDGSSRRRARSCILEARGSFRKTPTSEFKAPNRSGNLLEGCGISGSREHPPLVRRSL